MAGSVSSQQTLYTESLAAGAMPLVVPKLRPSTTASTLALPAAVLAVWVPWLSTSTGEMTSSGARFSGGTVSRKASAK
ncbi:hypothetical protein D3C73_828530 [compost metagenome]